jgi:hypothetical protein
MSLLIASSELSATVEVRIEKLGYYRPTRQIRRGGKQPVVQSLTEAPSPELLPSDVVLFLEVRPEAPCEPARL